MTQPAATGRPSSALRQGARPARPRPVHLQLRRLEHERDDQRHQRGPGHHGAGRADRDHALPAGHGGADDPRRQADRPLRPQAVLHVGLVVYGVGALLSAVAPGLGVLIIGNSILEGVGTALLIPPVYILTTLLFTDIGFTCPRLRRDQRDGRDRRRRGTADRRPHRHGDQLAGRVRLPGAGHRGDRRAEPARRPRPAAAGPDPPLRHRRSGPVRRRAGPGRHGHPGRRQQPLADGRPDRRRRPRPGVVLLLGARQGTCGPGAAALDGAVPQPHLQPRPGHAEHPVARAHRESRSSSRPTCRSCAATTRSRPA